MWTIYLRDLGTYYKTDGIRFWYAHVPKAGAAWYWARSGVTYPLDNKRFLLIAKNVVFK